MDDSLETFVPLQFKRKKGKLLVDGRDVCPRRPHHRGRCPGMYWHDLLDSGAFKSVVEIAGPKD
jgi:hypothetical protein